MRHVHVSRTAVMAVVVAGLIAGGCKPPKITTGPPTSNNNTALPEGNKPIETPCPAPSLTLTANSSTINAGQTSTLTWQAFNADSLRIEPEIGTVGLSGNRQVSPPASVTYTAYASSKCGQQQSGVARITVNQVVSRPPGQTEIATNNTDNGRTPPPPRGGEAPILPNNGGRGGAGQTVDTTRAPSFGESIKNILFDYDKSEIRPDQMPQLRTDADWLRQHPAVRVTVEGHADERGNQEYNLALGVRRANSIVEYLVGQGVSEARIRSISYGKERPECRDADPDESCHQKNRRAHFEEAR